MHANIKDSFIAAAAFTIGFLAIAPGSALCQTILVNDDLTSSAGCSTPQCGGGRTVTGGLDFTSQGWVPHNPDDSVMYNLGEIAVSGSLEFTVFNFAPYSQYNCAPGDQYAEFVGISEGTGPLCDHGFHPEAYVMVLYPPGKEWTDTGCLPIEGLAPTHYSSMRGGLNLNCEWYDASPEIYPDSENPANYRFKVEWDVAGARIYVTDDPSGEPPLVGQIDFDTYPNACSCECEQPLFQYICLGRTNSSTGWFTGPVFSNVVITKMEDYVPQDCCEEGAEAVEAVEIVENLAEEAVPDQPLEEDAGPDAVPDARPDVAPDARPDAAPDADAGGEGEGGVEGGCGCGIAR